MARAVYVLSLFSPDSRITRDRVEVRPGIVRIDAPGQSGHGAVTAKIRYGKTMWGSEHKALTGAFVPCRRTAVTCCRGISSSGNCLVGATLVLVGCAPDPRHRTTGAGSFRRTDLKKDRKARPWVATSREAAFATKALSGLRSRYHGTSQCPTAGFGTPDCDTLRRGAGRIPRTEEVLDGLFGAPGSCSAVSWCHAFRFFAKCRRPAADRNAISAAGLLGQSRRVPCPRSEAIIARCSGFPKFARDEAWPGLKELAILRSPLHRGGYPSPSVERTLGAAPGVWHRKAACG